MKKLLFILLSVLVSSCTENSRTRAFGGKQSYSIKENEIFINATWKDADLWILTKDTIDNQYHFREKSSFGMMEGEITFY